MNTRDRLRTTFLLLAAGVVVAWGILSLACAEPTMTYTRSSEDPTLDEPAMGTGLDRRDLDRLYDESMARLMGSRFMTELIDASPRHALAIMPFVNDTSEHIGPQLDALLSKMETTFVDDGRLDVIAAERRNEVLAELRVQQGGEFDAGRAAVVGRQLGADYLITGKVYDSAERTDDMRRTQYFMFVQVIDVETGAIRFQNESALTKALVPVE